MASGERLPDLRWMLERATGYRPDVVERRWAIETRHRRRAWEVIVERRMRNSYLEVTFRRGRPLAAYLYLPRKPKDKSYRTERVLRRLGVPAVTRADLAPLRAA